MPTKKVTKKAVVKKVAKTTPKKVAKKTVAKKVVKKVAKKAVKKSVSKKPLVYAADSVSFWVIDGQILNSLVALRDAFSGMNKDVYSYHAAKVQNDFSSWVSAVLGDDECAGDLEKAGTASAAKAVVVKHLKKYTI